MFIRPEIPSILRTREATWIPRPAQVDRAGPRRGGTPLLLEYHRTYCAGLSSMQPMAQSSLTLPSHSNVYVPTVVEAISPPA